MEKELVSQSTFSDNDLQQLKKLGIDSKTAQEQIKNFREGFPFLKLVKAATIGEGILKLEDKDVSELKKSYDEGIKSKKVLKFVPASGAASRMFKDLFSFLEKYDGTQDISNKDYTAINTFFTKIDDFAFFKDLKQIYEVETGQELEKAMAKKEYGNVLSVFLEKKGLNYGALPKGLLKFHKYDISSRTPTEEHLVEGANYAKGSDKVVHLHFTVSPEHKQRFQDHIDNVKLQYEKKFDVTFDITYSEQKGSTDTIAVDMNNDPFRNDDGSLLFRPGGHGALIENLNDVEADIIFIKNIDNVVPDRIKDTTFDYKKAIGGLLLKYQERIFDYLTQLSDIGSTDDSLIQEISNFLEKELCTLPEKDFSIKEDKISYLIKKLNRPIRVCGMVKNEGEPGGGPFWARNQDGTLSLQIVESSQVDLKNGEQNEIFKNATHFNPVDLVCGTKDYKGNKFNLLQFVDPTTGFVSKKSKDGRDLKALELPGLWNGAMANWNTVFVEVPIITFNPVKTVNDLLREEHQ